MDGCLYLTSVLVLLGEMKLRDRDGYVNLYSKSGELNAVLFHIVSLLPEGNKGSMNTDPNNNTATAFDNKKTTSAVRKFA